MSLTRKLVLVPLCFALACMVAVPRADAIDAESNMQCAPGGKKGQKCMDNTNGYQTQGTCAYVYVCKADNVNSQTPPVCANGSCPMGGPPPSNFNPYRKPITVASGSPEIPQSDISLLEQGVLNSVFGSGSTTLGSDADLQKISAAANARLNALSGDEEDILLYAPESFDSKTSVLFDQLRDQAVSLAPGLIKNGQTGTGGAVRLAYAGGGFFGGDVGGAGGSDPGIAIDLRSFIDAPQLFARGFANMVTAILQVLLADFSSAAQSWADARADFALSFQYLGTALTSLFAFLWEMIRTWFIFFSQ